MNSPQFNIIGAGAIGHLWAANLNLTGYTVRLYGKAPRTPTTIHLDSSLRNDEVELAIHTLNQWQPADYNIICVKAHQLDDLCRHLKSLPLNKSPVLLMMNGMGLVEIALRHLPNNPILQAYLVHGAYLKGSQIVHAGRGETRLGNLATDYTAANFTPLIQYLDAALPEVRWDPQHQQNMYIKLVINSVINPLTALSGQLNGSIVKQRGLVTDACELLAELSPLLQQIIPEVSLAEITQKVIRIATDTASNRSSMLQDREAGKTTEIDYINGYLIELAKQHGLTLPKHAALISQIKN